MTVNDDNLIPLLQKAVYIDTDLGDNTDKRTKKTGIKRGKLLFGYFDGNGHFISHRFQYEEDMATGEIIFIPQ